MVLCLFLRRLPCLPPTTSQSTLGGVTSNIKQQHPPRVYRVIFRVIFWVTEMEKLKDVIKSYFCIFLITIFAKGKFTKWIIITFIKMSGGGLSH